MKKIRFIHTADLHLDSPMAGLSKMPKTILDRLRESTFKAFSRIVDTAIEHEVDFVIIAGDLYDGEDRSLKAQSRFRAQMEKLFEKNIPVFAIHGNHDHLGGDWVKLAMPNNVHVFGSEPEMVHHLTKSGISVCLYGFSYPTRHVKEKKVDGYIKAIHGDFHIGILHGNDGSSSEHGNYCPFTVPELVGKQFDYWALGHIHKRAVLSSAPPVVYPGNIQGRNRKEKDEKGCYLVTLDEAGASLDFIEVNDCVWKETTISAKGLKDLSDILQLCQEEKERLRSEGAGVLLSIKLTDVSLTNSLEQESLYQDVLEILQDGEEEETSFIWTIKVSIEEEAAWRREDLIQEADFYSELFGIADHFERGGDVLEPVYGRLPGRKYLERPAEKEQSGMLMEAEKLLVKMLKGN
ncbi:DNA repair exonuclease [Bacillus sp. FJAT-18017]|uniref:metallophosphoesterase family protein n=1 Tax=Bacillus sp. FJAT-18017 TaxID=1705566 RepID=UPI0006AED889|nr:DNA repair exonuclease [Bacillus sp. FJAT-18017]ALC91954.1 DNA repair exonuclease [Bacillus sp. FJAT-18017]